ncbi:hypothetical protein [Reichenbachiella ulvae]|uniref:Tetratricopeptide repeat-containing protein n=1 Tax=Reichenbachiella ulvae TaxID=2980104 RepID=A0ABT3CXK1_9BACT|nr:hypothetical protein [Reichenbachiella ulvae]MCV9388264.1 hypothetical protein [Reichenbachiella ulvae]
MSKKSSPQPLFQLIKSLTKSEKRSFKLYVSRINEENEVKFITLFDILDRLEEYDEAVIIKKMSNISKAQLANLKSHLYKQVLLVLRISHLKNDVDIQLRENLDYVRLLYKKGLYDESMKLLNKIKLTANNYKKNIFKLALLNYEKNIENQQMLTLDTTTTLKLDRETKSILNKINVAQSFFSVALRMKAQFLKGGMARSEDELEKINKIFYSSLPEYDKAHLSFSEQYNMCRAYYWYSYLIQDFESCVKYTEIWVSIFKENNLTHLRHAEFLRGLNRLLQSLFRINDRDRFNMYYEELIEFEKLYMKAIDSNSKQLLLRCLTIQTLNKCFMEGDFKKYEHKLTRYLTKIEDNMEYIDRNNQLVIFYKSAILYFGLQDYEKCMVYLERVLEDHDEHLREDLKSFSYIIFVIALYEQRDYKKLEKVRKRAFVYLRQRNILGKFHHIILQFIKRSEHIMPLDLKGELKNLRSSLEPLREDKFESKPLLYFDIMSWLESKISGRSFLEVVKEAAEMD